jgi:uncharacterized tellurite resistance protein B-like protein
MFSKIFSRVINATDQDNSYEAKLALAALMVRIARSDDDYSERETLRIDSILALNYNLSRKVAANLRAEAETIEAQAPDTVRFTRAIKDAVPYEDRFEVVKALWQVVLADGERDIEEDALMRLLASLLGVNDRDSAIARQKS